MAMLTRRAFAGLMGAAALAKAQRKPNLVILFADDLGYGDLGCYGSPDVPTPHIDELARGGVRCTDGYVSAAVCSPSRAALLSGQYQQRFGHEFNSGPPEREAVVNFGLPPGVRIMPQYLKQAGYASAAIGKWHLGVREGFHPLDRGFDEFYGFLPGANDYITTHTPGGKAIAANDSSAKVAASRLKPILRGRQAVPENRYLTDALGAKAVDFIGRHKDQPFLLYLAFNAVHTPLHATEEYLRRVAGIRDIRHRYLAAMTVAMDDAVGAVVNKLRAEKLEEETLIFFLSDNGCPEITRAGSNGPLNGEKATYYEGGIRVPFIVRWKGRLPEGKVYRQPVVSRDVLPTFLRAAGVSADGARFDGVDLLPYLRGDNSATPHQTLFWRAGKARVVRQGKWKLLEFGDAYSRLFDLDADLGETTNLAARHPDVVRRLRREWNAWNETMKDPAWPARYRELTVNGEKLNWEL